MSPLTCYEIEWSDPMGRNSINGALFDQEILRRFVYVFALDSEVLLDSYRSSYIDVQGAWK